MRNIKHPLDIDREACRSVLTGKLISRFKQGDCLFAPLHKHAFFFPSLKIGKVGGFIILIGNKQSIADRIFSESALHKQIIAEGFGIAYRLGCSGIEHFKRFGAFLLFLCNPFLFIERALLLAFVFYGACGKKFIIIIHTLSLLRFLLFGRSFMLGRFCRGISGFVFRLFLSVHFLADFF